MNSNTISVIAAICVAHYVNPPHEPNDHDWDILFDELGVFHWQEFNELEDSDRIKREFLEAWEEVRRG